MNAELLVTGISQLVTAEGAGAKRGRRMRELRLETDAAIACVSKRIVWRGKEREWRGQAERTVDAGRRAVVPGLIDPHTHAVWAGDRLGDFEARISGSTYEEILAAGGGIRRTIAASAAATPQELAKLAVPRIEALVRSGATTIEVKSGYGFTVASELAMLEAIRIVARLTPAHIVATLLIHIPPVNAADREAYVKSVTGEIIPQVAKHRLASAVDVFVEKEAWHVDEAATILQTAIQYGLKVKLHTEQFHCIGGVELGIRTGALSVDHLEVCGVEQLQALAASATIATILPGVALHLGIRAAAGRQLIDEGIAVAVGTDLNPGSSPLYSASMALALAVRLNGLTAAEALVAGTVNAACALGLEDRGRIEVGALADFLVLEGKDWRELVYTLGANPISEVWIGGEKVHVQEQGMNSTPLEFKDLA